MPQTLPFSLFRRLLGALGLLLSTLPALSQTFPAVPTAPPTGLQGTALRDWLRTNWYDGKRTVLSYSAARAKLYNYVDNEQNKVRCVYSGYEEARPLSFTSTSTTMQNINCEHTVPQSWFDEVERMRSDIHHLFPTVAQWNSDRGSDPFAEIPDAQTTKWMRLLTSQSSIPASNLGEWSEDTNSQFEPRDDHKGNLARAVFYFYTMHSGQTFDAGKGVITALGSLNMLYQWHLQDPVDAHEAERNRRAAASQGNYNPYINDPALVARAWGFAASGDPTVQFAAASGTQTEGNSGSSSYQLSVTLTAAPTATVTVQVATDASGSTATAGADYTFTSPQTLTFGPGLPTAQTVTVTVAGDATAEPDELLRLRLQSLSGPATLGTPATHDLTIANDDAASGISTLAFATASGSQTEGNAGTSTHTVNVTLTPAASGTVTVPISVDAANTTADAADYTLNTSTLTFTAGQTSRPVTITVSGDATVEPDELLRLRLGTPTGSAVVSTTADTYTLTIRNDDAASGGSEALSCGGLFFSEYIESTSGSNKAVEIFNPSAEAVNLTGYRVQLFANGAAANNPTTTLNLTGTLGSREVYVIINNQSQDQNFLDQGDAVSGVTNFNGDDALTLSYNGTVIDVIGVVGTDPGTSWSLPSGGSTADFILRRTATAAKGNTAWAQASSTWRAIEAADPASSTAYADLGQHSAEECSGLLLPVTLTAFTARRAEAARVLLQWRTAQELHNAGFVVEASANGQQFRPVSPLLPAQAGSGPRSYQWTTEAAPQAAYYRLRQQDHDGAATLSAPVFVPAAGQPGRVTVAPNPISGPATLHGLPAGQLGLALHSAHGRPLASANTTEAAAAETWLNQALQTAAPGVYVLTVEAGGQRQHVRLVKP